MTKKVLNTNIPDENIPDSFKTAKRLKPHSGTTKTKVTINKEKDLAGLDYQDFKQQTGTEGFVLSPTELATNQNSFNEILNENAVRTEDIEAYTQGWTDKLGNGVMKFAGRALTSIAGSTIGTLYGLMAWGKEGEFKAFYDNDFQHGLDGINDYIAEEFKHHYTSDPNDWEIGNFWYDKVFDGLGFATGAVISGMIGGNLTSGITKGLSAGNVSKSAALKILRATHKEKGLSSAASFTDEAAFLSKQARLDKLKGIPQTVSSMATGAVYESGFEARTAYNEIKEDLLTKLIESKSTEGIKYKPTDKELKNINKLAGETANGIFAGNMALVGSSQFLQFGRHLGLDYKDVVKLFAKKSIAKQTGKEFTKKGSKFLRGVKAVVSKPITESQEEMLQSVMSATGKDYALKKYDNEGKADLTDLLTSTIKAAKKTYTSKEGWEEGLIGAIIGGMGVVGPKTKADGRKGVGLLGGIYEGVGDFKADEALRDEIIEVLNKTNAITTLNSSIKHTLKDGNLEKAKDEYLERDDEFNYKNAQDIQLHSYVASRIEAGMVDSIYDEIKELRNLSLEDFKKTFGIPEDVKYTEEEQLKQIDSLQRRVRQEEKSHDYVESVYPSLTSEDKQRLTFNHSMMNRINERQETIASNINRLTEYAGLDLNAVNEDGTRKSSEEMFKGVAKKNKVNKDSYDKLYEDYHKLTDRSDAVLADWQEATTKIGQAELKRKLDVEKKKRIKELNKNLNKKNKAAKHQKEQEAKKEAIENTNKNVNLVKEIDDLFNSGSGLSETEGSEETRAMFQGNEQAIVDDINKVTDSKQLKNLFDQSGGTIGDISTLENLPLEIKQAINKKLKEFAQARKDAQKIANDKKGTSTKTPNTKNKKTKQKATINDKKEINVPPVDLKDTKNVSNNIKNSNNGKVVQGVSNQAVQKESTIYRVGRRLVEGWSAIAVSTRAFIEDTLGIQNVDDTITTNTSTIILSAKEVNVGDTVTIRRLNSDYLENSDGTKTENTRDENQILEIVYKNQVIGYVHTEDYVSNPTRIVDGQLGDNIPDNIQRNIDELRKLRKEIFAEIGTDPTKTKTIKIAGKTAGSIMTTASGRYNVPFREAFKNDKRPRIVTVKNNGLYIGNQPIEESELKDKLVYDFSTYESEEGSSFFEDFTGVTMMAVPGANGKYILTLAQHNKLEDVKLGDTNAVEVINKVMQAYVMNDEETLSKFNIINTEQEVEKYIRNLIYTTGEQASDHYMYFTVHPGTGERVINYKDTEGTIRVLNAKVISQKTSTETPLQKTLKNKLFSLNLIKISNTRVGKKQIKQKIQLEDGSSVVYEDLVKDNILVNFTGHKIPVGDSSSTKTERVYVANPIITLDTNTKTEMGINPKTVEEDTLLDETPMVPTNLELEEGEEFTVLFDENESEQTSEVEETLAPEDNAIDLFGDLGININKKSNEDLDEDSDMEPIFSPSRWVSEDIGEGLGTIQDANGNIVSSSETDKLATSIMTILYSIISDPSRSKMTVKESTDWVKASLISLRNGFNTLASKETITDEDIQNFKRGLATPEDNQKMVENYDLAINNFDGLVELALQKLKERNFEVINNKVSESKIDSLSNEDVQNDGEAEYLEEGSTDNVKTSYDEGAVFKKNPIEGMSAKVRMMLSNILKNEKNILGLPTYYDFYEVYTTLLDTLSNRVDATLEELIEELKQHTDKKPYLIGVIELLSSDKYLSVSDKNSFHSNLRKVYVEFELIKKESNTDIKPIKSNRNTLSKTIEQSWLVNIGDDKIFKTNEDGQITVDEAYRDDTITALWNNIESSDYSVEAVAELLNALGIKIESKIDAETGNKIYPSLEYLKANSKQISGIKTDWKTLFGSTTSAMFTALKDRFFADTKPDVHPLETEGYLKKLAKIESLFRENTSTDSFQNAENKTIFSYIVPSWVYNRLNKLIDADGIVQKDFINKLLNIPYLSWSTHLYQLLDSDPYFRNNYGVTVMDTIKDGNKQGSKYSSLSPKEQTAAVVNLFVNGIQGKQGAAPISKFVVSKSDKHVLNILTVLKHELTTKGEDLATGNFSEVDSEAILNLVRGEYSRIIDAQNKREEGINFEDLATKVDDETGEILTGYNPFKFYNFAELNYLDENGNVNEIASTLYDEAGQLIDYENSEELEESVEKILLEIISQKIINEIRITKQDLIEKGIITDSKLLLVDKSYIDKYGSDVNYFVADFVINYMISTNEYNAIFQGDIATAAKKSKSSEVPQTGVVETLANMFKRLAKEIAPATRGAKHANDPYNYNSYNHITLRDAFNSSLNMSQLIEKYGEKSNIIKEYAEIEGTDAQELTLLSEHLNVMFHHGMLTEDQYNTLMPKALSGTEYTEDELALVIKVALQPMKPVAVGQKYLEEYGVDLPIYIKTSSFPLVPQLIKGTEFEKLEKIMRTNKDAQGNSDPIHRAVFESGVKLGQYKTIDAWNKVKDDTGEDTKITNGTFNEDAIKQALSEGAYLSLDRDNFGIQQDVPYDENKTEILEGSQLMKLILSAVQGKGEFTKSEIIKNFHKIHIDITENLFSEFMDKIGAKEDAETGKITFSNVTKVRDMLLAELTSRGGYNANDLKALEIETFVDENNKEVSRFKVPLWASAKSSKYEALLNSVISKKILRQKIPGKSYVLGSEEGWLGNSTSIEKVANTKLKGTAYDSTTGLKPQRTGYTDPVTNTSYEDSDIAELDKTIKDRLTKVVFPAQVLITKGKFKNTEMVGYRIPTQGLNSMSAMEVVGYLPDYMADLLIAPKDFTKQMGSDFDIDKLYVHRKHENVTTDQQTSQNALMDTYWDTLTHLDNLKRILQPLDFGNLGTAVKNINAISPIEQHHHLSPIYQTDNYENGNAGKFGVSATSIVSTSKSLYETADGILELEGNLNFKIRVSDGKGGVKYKTVEVNDLKRGETLDEVTKDGEVSTDRIENVISAFQSASVDNIKELLIKTINYNRHTHDAFTTLAFLGLNDEYISYFLAQPIIKEFVKTKENLGGMFSNIQGDITEMAFDEIITKYITQLEDIGMSEEEIEDVIADGNKPYSEKELLTSIEANEIAEQLSLLMKFKLLSSEGKHINSINRALQPATSGIGQDRLSASMKYDLANDAIYKPKIIGASSLFGDLLFEVTKENEKTGIRTPITDEYGNNIFIPTTIAGKGIEVLRRSNNLFDRFFKINALGNQLTERISKNSALRKSDLTEKQKRKIINFSKSYIFSGPMNFYFGESIQELRERLLYGTDNIAARWNKFKSQNPENYLAKRINTEDKGVSKQSRIYYMASAADRPGDSNNTNELVAMLKSNDEVTVKLAQDTIAYTYARGGIQDALSLIKFIPTKYLMVNKMGETVNNQLDSLLSVNDNRADQNIALEQYLQHNPYHAFRIDNLDFVENDNTIVLNKKSINPIKNKYISYETNGKFKLFKYAGKDVSTGNPIYNQISNLGTSTFLEAQYNTKEANSVLATNNVEGVKTEGVEIPPVNGNDSYEVKVTEAAIPNINKLSTNKYLDNLPEMTANQVLGSIVNKNGNKDNRDLARTLLPLLIGTPVQIVDTKEVFNKKADGAYLDGVIYLDKDLKDIDFVRVVLHEAVHAVVADIINNPVTEQQKELRKSINEVYQAFLKSYTGNTHSGRNAKLSLNEFIAELMSDSNFQNELANTDFTKNQSVWERLLEVFHNIIGTLSGKEVVKVTTDNVIKLMQTTGSSPVSINTSNIVSEALENEAKDLLKEEIVTEEGVYPVGTEVYYLYNEDGISAGKVLGYTIDKKLIIEDRDGTIIKKNNEPGMNIPFSPKRNVSQYFDSATKSTDAVTALKEISNSNHLIAPLAKHLIKYAEANNITLNLVDKDINRNGVNHAGMYYGTSADISLASATETTIVHEVLHALSHKNLVENPNTAFNVLFEKAKSVYGTDYYALSNIDEFMVGLFTDTKFIKALQEIPAIEGLKQHDNLFIQIFDMIFGKVGIFSSNTLFDQAFAVATNVLEDSYSNNKTANVLKNEYEKAMSGIYKNDIFDDIYQNDIDELNEKCK